MKKLLAILPYENIYPPMSGGMQRCFHLLHQLANYFEVTALTYQPADEFKTAEASFPSIGRVRFKTISQKNRRDIFQFFPSKLEKGLRYRWLKKSFKGPAGEQFLFFYDEVKSELLHGQFDLIFLDNLSSLDLVDLIRRTRPNARVIYSAHNVDTLLAAKELQKNKISRAGYLSIKRKESELFKLADEVIACSKEDVTRFREMNDRPLKMEEIPNGVEISSRLWDKTVQSDHPENIIFCGSLHYHPNSEALLWFYFHIWPDIKKKLPELKLIVVGSGQAPDSLQGLLSDPSIIFKYNVADVRPSYEMAGLTIVPLKTGSGTRLKILESMSLGIPVLSTTIGAEGIQYVAGRDLIIADDENTFACQVIELVSDKSKRLMLQRNARTIVERYYDWNKIGLTLSQFLNTA
jgi:glycosyltransferase involved in cell wall biosynthesis